ncbi:MAG: GTP-binding protein [Lachnospiraceae bacterium]
MKKIYIVTGFLGAGKTTFINEFISLFPMEKLKIIVNEFGSVGVDGDVLRKSGAQVEEINSGSIFCSCRMDHFENALQKVLAEEKEIILVETSGLSDTTKARHIICDNPKFKELAYAGCICLIDAARFHKVLKTALVVQKQVMTADIFLLNKTDLVEAEDLQATVDVLKGMNEQAVLYQTSFGKIEGSFRESLQNPVVIDLKDVVSTNDITTRKFVISLAENQSIRYMERFIRSFLIDTYRVKGFIKAREGVFLVNGVGKQLDIVLQEEEAYASHLDTLNQLVVLSGGGMPTKSTIKKSVELFSDCVISWT